MAEGMAEWFIEIGRRLDIPLAELAVSRFSDYVRLLREWNGKVNLTAILDDEGIAVRHLLDSLTLLPWLAACTPRDPAAGLTLIDVGTGAGFPGLPLKIVRPDLQVLLLDSLAKRVKFLDQVITDLRLENISTLHGRAEEAARQPGLRDHFDIATARAVASLPTLSEYCLPFVRVGGCFLAMKGQIASEWSEASKAIRILGGEIEEVRKFDLPGTDMKRTIIKICKVRPTPPAYPRKAGKPEKQPLL